MNTVGTFLTEAFDRISELSPELAREVRPIREILVSPPRIAIVGRIKAGKSTLTNALIGATKAETAALEATNVVTAYHYGSPDRAVITLKDRRKIPWEIRQRTNNEPPVPVDRIAYIDRWMPIGTLRQFTLIDTPGLATLTTQNEQATRSALIEEQGDLSVNADGAVFLFDSAPRRDEIDFIHNLGFTSLNTLGVLSHADSFDEGALGEEDPFDRASAFAADLKGRLSNMMLDVIPVSGLLAETALTGELTEKVARRVAGISKFSTADILTTLLSHDQVEGLNKQDCLDIVNLIGEYGIFHGAVFATGGAATLNTWLEQRSGIQALKDMMGATLDNYATLHRASRTINELELLALHNPDHQREIRNIISTAVASKDMLPARLFGALKALQMSNSNQFVTDAVTRMLAETSTATRLGLTPDANKFQILDRLEENRTKLKRLTLTCNPAEEVAIPLLLLAYEDLEKPEKSWL